MNYLGRAICYELRAAGVPVAYVAERLGISRGRVSQITKEVQREFDAAESNKSAEQDIDSDLDIDLDL